MDTADRTGHAGPPEVETSFKNRRKRARWNVDYLESSRRQNARRSSNSHIFLVGIM
jgi:hypothetical protein